MTVARSSEPLAFKNRLIIFGLSTHPNSSLSCIVCPPPSEATQDFTRMSNSPDRSTEKKRKKNPRIKYTRTTFVSTPSEIISPSPVTSIIVYGDDQGEGGAEGHYSGDGRCPWSLAVLNFHPTVHVVACNTTHTSVLLGLHISIREYLIAASLSIKRMRIKGS